MSCKPDDTHYACDCFLENYGKLIAERDELRAELNDFWHHDHAMYKAIKKERDELRAEVARLRHDNDLKAGTIAAMLSLCDSVAKWFRAGRDSNWEEPISWLENAVKREAGGE